MWKWLVDYVREDGTGEGDVALAMVWALGMSYGVLRWLMNG